MTTKRQPELCIAMFENGKLFIELDSLIDWFENQPDDELKTLNKYAACALTAMKEKGTKNPDMVMHEEAYLAREEKK